MAEWDELHPVVAAALTRIGIRPDHLSQVVGGAAASAGYHLAEGTINGHEFTSCVDISPRVGFSAALKSRLVDAGGCPFFRDERDHMAAHCHVVFVGLRDHAGRVTIKPGPRTQIIDYCRGLSGLVGHGPYTGDFAPTAVERQTLYEAYAAWAPHVATKVFLADGTWVPCYAFLEEDTVRCEVRPLLERLGASVGFADGHIQVTKGGTPVDLSRAHLALAGDFMRGDVRGLAEAVGMRVVKFTWVDPAHSACQIVLGRE